MKIKKFYAADMRTAIKRVKEELGAEAVILSSRQVDGRSEIVAATDIEAESPPTAPTVLKSNKVQRKAYEPVGFDKPSRTVTEHSYELPEDIEFEYPSSMQASDADLPVDENPVVSMDEHRWAKPVNAAKISESDLPKAFQSTEYEPQTSPYSDPALGDIQRELREMRSLIQEQVDHWSWGDFTHKQPVKAQILRRMTEMGFTVDLGRRVVMAIPDGLKSSQAWNEALVGLSHRVRCTEDDITDFGGIVALAGSAGGGKTTTIAKLAARYAMKHGKEKVAIVCADQYRIGARAQLQTFAQIMGVSLYTAVDGAELREQLSNMPGKTLILVDLPASRSSGSAMDAALEFMGGLPTAKTYVVESATVQPAVFERIIGKLSSLKLAGVMLTRVDEAVSLGEILSVCIEQELKIAYIADGPRVPEDLRLARASKLVVKSVELARKKSKKTQSNPGLSAVGSGLKR